MRYEDAFTYRPQTRHLTATSRALPGIGRMCMHGSQRVHASHALHAPATTWIHVVLSPATGAAHAVMPTTTPEGNSRRYGRVAQTGSGVFRVPRAQPLPSRSSVRLELCCAFRREATERTSSLSRPLLASTLKRRGPVPACLPRAASGWHPELLQRLVDAAVEPFRCLGPNAGNPPGSDCRVRPALGGRDLRATGHCPGRIGLITPFLAWIWTCRLACHNWVMGNRLMGLM